MTNCTNVSPTVTTKAIINTKGQKKNIVDFSKTSKSNIPATNRLNHPNARYIATHINIVDINCSPYRSFMKRKAFRC